MYLFYVVTTNILLCIFSFFADVLSYDNTFLLFYFFTLKSSLPRVEFFHSVHEAVSELVVLYPHFGAISMSAGDWLTKRSTMMSLRRRSR